MAAWAEWESGSVQQLWTPLGKTGKWDRSKLLTLGKSPCHIEKERLTKVFICRMAAFRPESTRVQAIKGPHHQRSAHNRLRPKMTSKSETNPLPIVGRCLERLHRHSSSTTVPAATTPVTSPGEVLSLPRSMRPLMKQMCCRRSMMLPCITTRMYDFRCHLRTDTVVIESATFHTFTCKVCFPTFPVGLIIPRMSRTQDENKFFRTRVWNHTPCPRASHECDPVSSSGMITHSPAFHQKRRITLSDGYA